MKKTLLTVLAVILGSQANAADLYCGASVEKDPGSHVYNKSVFWEKADTAKPTVHFLLADGTQVKSDELTPESYAKVIDGTLALGISFTEGRTQLFVGKVKRNKENQIQYADMAMAGSFNGNSSFLNANGAVLMCKEY